MLFGVFRTEFAMPHTALLFTDSDLTTGPTTPFECIFSSFVKLQQSTEASSVAFWIFRTEFAMPAALMREL